MSVHQSLCRVNVITTSCSLTMKQPPKHKKNGDLTTISPSSTNSSSPASQFHRKARSSFDDEMSSSTTATPTLEVPESTSTNVATKPMRENRWNSCCTDILVFTFVILGFASLSIFVGVAAGISISIFFFEGLQADHRRLIMGYYGIPGYNVRQTFVTHSDTSIASSHGDAVLASTEDGETAMYPVVEENKLDVMMIDGAYSAPKLRWEEWRMETPQPCRTDPNVTGYQTYAELDQALHDVNRYSAERNNRWTEYLDRSPDSFYSQEEITFTICPATTLYGFFGPLFVNTESLTIACDDCTLSSWGSHLSFGPAARNVRIVGMSFRHSTSSSMSFPYDGAEVTFENCRWKNNSSGKPTEGSVLDIKSGSVVQFFRCFVSKPRGGWRRGYQMAALSIRK